MRLPDPVAERIARGIERIARHGRVTGAYFGRGTSAGKDRPEGPCCILGSLYGATPSGDVDRSGSETAELAVTGAFRDMHGLSQTLVQWHDQPCTTDGMVYDVLGAALAARGT